MKKTSDEDLINLLQEGDENAFMTFIQRYQRYLYALVNEFYNNNRKIVKSDKAELISIGYETTMDVLQSYESTNYSSFYPYWKVAVERQFIHFVQKKKENHGRFISYSDEYKFDYAFQDLDPYIDSTWKYEEKYSRSDYIELLDYIDGIEGLDSNIITLKIEGCTINEIAEMLNCSIQKVKYQLRKLKDKLKERTNS